MERIVRVKGQDRESEAVPSTARFSFRLRTIERPEIELERDDR